MDYDDIQLIECNRQSSVQARSGNDTQNGVFTCTLGNTIQLEEGDIINIQNAFISEDGAGGDGIEFKGEPIRNEGGNKGVSVDYEFTRVETTYDKSFDEIGNKAVELVRDTEGTKRNQVVTKQLYDNVVNLETTFYKTNNGECCFMMPRRFCYNEADDNTATFDAFDVEGLGQAYFTPRLKRQIVPDDYFLTSQNPFHVGSHSYDYYKPKNDNKRFTMFMKADNYRRHTDVPADYIADFGRSVMVKDYVEYIELKEISVKAGFNSPNSIAEQVTQQLQKVVEYNEVNEVRRRQPEVLEMNDNSHDVALAMPRRVLSTWHTETYKPVFTFTSPVSDEVHFTAFYNSTDNQDTVDYLAAFQYIYVKRPDIFKRGRQCNDGLGFVDGVLVDEVKSTGVPNFIKNDISLASEVDPIVTQWEYTTENLELLNELFKAQGKYPELFDNSDLFVGEAYSRNVNNSRFLHINIWASHVATYSYLHQLGDDGIFDWSAIGGEPTTHQSLPIFFSYDPANADKETGGDHIENLSYGFATRTYARDEFLNDGTKAWYITLHPELFTTASERWSAFYFANYGPGPIVKDTIQIGWDYHANSYGNIVMAGNNGLWRTQYSNDYSYGLLNFKPKDATTAGRTQDYVDFMNAMYVGANNPALAFDSDSGTFGWEYLHTAEHVGQPYNSGATEQELKEGENTLPLVADASQECYKINKRLQYWNFNPDMRPYNLQSDLVLGGSAANTFKTKITNFNPNLEQWGIYDAHSGIYLNCGKTASQKDWSKTLLGIIGFSWEQFNSQTVDEGNNIQARINNNNRNHLDQKVTTNSQVVSTDTINFNMNIWGGINYGTMICPPIYINSWDIVTP